MFDLPVAWQCGRVIERCRLDDNWIVQPQWYSRKVCWRQVGSGLLVGHLHQAKLLNIYGNVHLIQSTMEKCISEDKTDLNDGIIRERSKVLVFAAIGAVNVADRSLKAFLAPNHQ